MKKLALLAICLVSAASAFAADGSFSFGNRVTSAGIDAPVMDALGAKLSGSAYMAQLYVGTTEAGMAAVGTAVPFRTGAAIGYISTTSVDTPGIAAGTTLFVQFRAWRAAAGATWEAAKSSLDANAAGNWGQSATLNIASGGVPDPVTGIPGFPANLTGLSSFSLQSAVIPEPSTIALGILGASVLFLRRRK